MVIDKVVQDLGVPYMMVAMCLRDLEGSVEQLDWNSGFAYCSDGFSWQLSFPPGEFKCPFSSVGPTLAHCDL